MTGITAVNRRVQRLLYWSPRILSLVVVWIAAEHLPDWISPTRGFGQNLLSVLVHLLPAFIVLAIVLVSWKREWIAGVFFILLGILRLGKDLMVHSFDHLWLSTFGVLLGLLFVLNWKYRAELRGAARSGAHTT